MTQSARKALSRFRKLQDKILNQQVAGCKTCDIMASDVCNGDKTIVVISIFLHRETTVCNSWRFYGTASEDEVENILRDASEYINFQI